MRPYSQQAYELKLALEAGVVDNSEIIGWADNTLTQYDYDDDVANLSMARQSSRKELIVLLSALVEDADEINGMRTVMGRIYQELKKDPNRVRGVTEFLEGFWIKQNYSLPEDMDFICGVHDDFLLAEQGLFRNVKSMTKSLIANLSKYQ